MGVFPRLALCVALVGSALAAASSSPAAQQDEHDSVAALIQRGRYDSAERVARANFESQVASTGIESAGALAAADELVRALRVNGKATTSEARELAELAVRLKEKSLGANSVGAATSLLNLAELLTESGAIARAEMTARRAASIRQRKFGANSPELADALHVLGTTLVQAGSAEAAMEILDRALLIEDSALEPNDVRTAETLEAIASAQQGRGNYPAARRALDRAVSIRGAAGIAHPAYATTLNLLSLQLWFEGRMLEARATAQAAIDLTQRTLGPAHPLLAQGLTNLAAVLTSMGDVAGALSLQERALDVVVNSRGPTHFQVGRQVNDIANSNLLLGNYSVARSQFEKALQIGEANFGPSHQRIATYVHNLALVDALLGDYAAARRQQIRATAIWERTLGRDHPFVAVALTELAVIYRQQQAHGEAIRLFERALSIRERRLGPDHPDVARTLADLALTLSATGQFDRAQPLAARALRIWERVNEPNAPDYATVLQLYAELQAARGEFAASRVYYERALAIRESAFGMSHPAVAESEAGLAQALAASGNVAEAFQRGADAEAVGREHLRLMLRYLPERESLNYAATRPRGLDLMLSLEDSSHGSASISLDALIRARALVLDEMAARRVADEDDSTLKPLRDRLISEQQRLANLIVRGPGIEAIDRFRQNVDDARRSKETAERALAQQSATFRSELSRGQVGLDEVKAALPAGSALVSFARYQRITPGSTLPPIASYVAFVTRSGEGPIVVAIGAADGVERLVARWRADIARAAPSAAAQRLRQAVWDPLTPYIRNASAIFIVPDAALNVVPFAALPGVTSEYVLEEAPVIHYFSAERDLVIDRPVSTTRGLLAIGGPSFDDSTALTVRPGSPALRAVSTQCGSFQNARFGPLDGTRQEVQDIASLWNGDGFALVLTARDATETAFKTEASKYRILHLATHGFFLNGDCPSPALRGLRAVGGLAVTPSSSGLTKAAGIHENPLLLSGLALAGANRRAAVRPGEDDGILTAEEVSSLNLDGVEWAVLSACETGIGEIKAGEGVLGLRRAFQVAGVRTIIMSLWSVEDQATRLWMRALYEGRLQRQLSTADAVREASLTVLRDRRARGLSTNPFYWAAFVAAGDWR